MKTTATKLTAVAHVAAATSMTATEKSIATSANGGSLNANSTTNRCQSERRRLKSPEHSAGCGWRVSLNQLWRESDMAKARKKSTAQKAAAAAKPRTAKKKAAKRSTKKAAKTRTRKAS